MLTVALLLGAMMALTRADDPSINHTSILIAQDACANGWHHHDKHCFTFVPRQLTWASAESNCQSMGGHLASVHSIEEYHFLQSLIQDDTASDPSTWIGGSDCQEENTWFWIDGSTFSFNNWCQGEPDHGDHNQHCIQINYGGGKCWDDVQCSALRPSLCAKDDH